MIETAQGLENVAEIAATPGLDGLYVGPFDLSISLGLAKPADFTDPVLLAALDVVLDAAARHDLVTGIYAGSPENALMLAQRGFRLVTAAQDTALLQTAWPLPRAIARRDYRSFLEEELTWDRSHSNGPATTATCSSAATAAAAPWSRVRGPGPRRKAGWTGAGPRPPTCSWSACARARPTTSWTS